MRFFGSLFIIYNIYGSSSAFWENGSSGQFSEISRRGRLQTIIVFLIAPTYAFFWKFL